MKEFVTITWQGSSGLVRSSFTLPCRDMLMASMIQSELAEIARKIQDAQGIEMEDIDIIPGLIGHA